MVRRFRKLAKTFAIIGSVAALVETAIVFGTLAEPDFANMQPPDVNDQEHQDTATMPNYRAIPPRDPLLCARTAELAASAPRKRSRLIPLWKNN